MENSIKKCIMQLKPPKKKNLFLPEVELSTLEIPFSFISHLHKHASSICQFLNSDLALDSQGCQEN